MSILLTPRPLEDLVLAYDREPKEMPGQGDPAAIDQIAQYLFSTTSPTKPNVATLHVSSAAADQDEELAEITNTLVLQKTRPPATPQSRVIKDPLPASTSGSKGDIRTYFIPHSASDHTTANTPSRASRSSAGVHSYHSVSTFPIAVIDLTADDPGKPITDGATGVKRPRGRPPKLSDAKEGPQVPRPRGRPRKISYDESQQLQIQRPVGRPRKVSHDEPQQPQIKRPVGRPRKYQIDEPRVEGPLEQSHKVVYVEIPYVSHSQKPRQSAITDIASTDVSSGSPRRSNPNTNGVKHHDRAFPSVAPARRPPVQNQADDLAAALTSAFSQNAASQRNAAPQRTAAPQDQNLVSALSSAFANNAVTETFYADEDESGEPSLASDSESEAALEHELPERPRRRRHRRVITPVTQIPSPVKRSRPQRAPKDIFVAPNEQTMHEQLDTESSSLQLPVGVSIAPENESEYMDPDDGVLLDYDSSAEVEEEREKKRKHETALAPKILGNNLRFLQAQRRHSSHRKRLGNSSLRRDISAVRSTLAYTQRVESYCGEPALDYIWGGRQAWYSNWKPKQYKISADQFNSASASTSEFSDSNDSQIEEEAEEPHEAILNGVVSMLLTKRSHPEGNAAPQKRVKFAADVQLKASLTAAGPRTKTHPQFDAIRCGELLQKLVKGKLQMTEQELHEVLLFFGDPSFEQFIREFRNGEELDVLGADDQQQAHDSIWISLQYIAQSAAGSLGIPEMFEGTLKWEVKKIVDSVKGTMMEL
ncbi:hypothetical protein GYMLUDRAFT_367258 [Collybiopsis luxurians FD-317 M1]|nr:hypothetical protein GYMLUDRAFT_367258 [Collybiopsis luxurians FD-317 M1]